MNHPSMVARLAIQGLSMLAVLLLVLNPARALVIDDFNSGPLSLQVTNLGAEAGQTVIQTGLSPSSVFSGTRSVYVGSALGSAMGEIDSAAGQFNFGTDANAQGYFKLTYGSVTTPQGVNLAVGGNSSFQLRIAESSLSGIYLGARLNVYTGNSWKNYGLLRDLSQDNGSVDIIIPFASFVGADMTQVRAIQLEVARFSPSSYISIDSITTIPEPATTGIVSLGFIFLSALRSRNLKQTTGARASLWRVHAVV